MYTYIIICAYRIMNIYEYIYIYKNCLLCIHNIMHTQIPRGKSGYFSGTVSVSGSNPRAPLLFFEASVSHCYPACRV